MKRYILILISFCAFSQLWAQKELNNWVFGYKSGLTWNTKRSMLLKGLDGTPDKTLDGLPSEFPISFKKDIQIQATEGFFTMSDKRGNLLFYSDGITIWNKNNEIMLNGSNLTGSFTAAQAGIVINYPGDANKYIVFAIDQWYRGGLAYSVVDMTLDNGLGGVELFPDGKNYRLLEGALGAMGESVTAVRHSNLVDFWLVAPGKSSGVGEPTYMNVWKIDSDGVHWQSLNSSISVNLDTSDTSTKMGINGYCTFDARGNHFVWPICGFDMKYGMNGVTLFGKFNPEDGIFESLSHFIVGLLGYGAEFSLSGKYLYLPEMYYWYSCPEYAAAILTGNATVSEPVLRVFDFEELLSASDPNSVTPYKTVTSGHYQGAAQMGPDGRIYIPSALGTADFNPERNTYDTSRDMIIVDNVEDPDNLKLYIAEEFITPVDGATPPSSVFSISVPTFSKSWLYASIDGAATFCNRTLQNYTVDLDEYATKASYIIWDWGDGNRPAQVPVSTGVQDYSASHKYTAAGLYTISVEVYVSGDTSPNQIHTYDIEVQDCGIYVNPHIQSVVKK